MKKFKLNIHHILGIVYYILYFGVNFFRNQLTLIILEDIQTYYCIYMYSSVYKLQQFPACLRQVERRLFHLLNFNTRKAV